jgi:hypothetical protein
LRGLLVGGDRLPRSGGGGGAGNDWGRVADQLHPEALAEVKENLMPLLQQAAQAGGEQQILGLFAGVDSMEGVAALSERDFFNRYLSGRLLIQPNLGEMLRQASTEILGELPGDTEGETFVVYRFKGDPAGVQFENLDVVKVRLDGETWRPMLTDDLKSLARPF